MKVFIPENLELTSRHRDKYYYIVSRIYKEGYLNKNYTEQSFVPLNSHILLDILGGYYIKHLRYLIDGGIVESDNCYIIGKKSKGYRLTEKYRVQKCKAVQLYNTSLIETIKCYKNDQIFKMRSHCTFAYLLDCLEKVEIDYSGALNYIHDNVTETTKEIPYILSVEELNSSNLYCKVDNTAGRLHTNITSFPSVLRKYLSYQEKELVEIDVANSQPLLFNILIYQYISNDSSYNNEVSIYQNIPPYGNSINTNISYYKDIPQYKQLTESGKFYEYLMEKLGSDEDRSIFKKHVFGKIFFCQENSNYIREERKLFAELFPTTSEIISFYKKDDYKNLPIELQKAEAKFILHTIVPILKEKGIYTLTIHDSILTTRENAKYVKSMMEKEFKTKFNLNPTIRIK